MSFVINNSEIIRLPIYKKWAEHLLNKNSRLTGLVLAGLHKEIVDSPPEYIKIETTNACNAKCVYCPRDKMTRPIGSMGTSLFSQIIDEVVDWGISTIHLQNYGEPLIDPYIIDRIRYSKQKGVKYITLFTNAALLNNSMAIKLIDAGLDEFNISIDPGTKEMHNNIRCNLSYEEIVGNIGNLINLRKSNKLFRPKIILSSNIYHGNKNDVINFIDRWKEVVDEIHLQDVHNWALKDSENHRHRFPCQRLWLTFTILWDGRVSICCVDYDGKYILGDVRKSTIKEIWNSEEYSKMRLFHLKMNPQINICKNCTLRRKDSPLWIKKIL